MSARKNETLPEDSLHGMVVPFSLNLMSLYTNFRLISEHTSMPLLLRTKLPSDRFMKPCSVGEPTGPLHPKI